MALHTCLTLPFHRCHSLDLTQLQKPFKKWKSIKLPTAEKTKKKGKTEPPINLFKAKRVSGYYPVTRGAGDAMELTVRAVTPAMCGRLVSGSAHATGSHPAKGPRAITAGRLHSLTPRCCRG